MEKIKIEIPKFITHIQLSKNKFIKINGQKIFVGINHHLRSLIVRKIHTYLKEYISPDIKLPQIPIKISLEFHAPLNYGNVRIVKNTLSWKKAIKGYTPKWDADNQWIWGKCFNDVLIELNIIPDDNVSIIRSSGEVKFIEVENLEDRKLVFIIESI